MKELHTEFTFKGSHRLGQRWLRDVEMSCRASEATMVNHTKEVREVTDVHTPILPLMNESCERFAVWFEYGISTLTGVIWPLRPSSRTLLCT